MDASKHIYLGSDEQGRSVKELLKEFFQSKGIKYLDIGLFNGDTAEFSKIKSELKEKVKEEDAIGIMLFGKQQLIIEDERKNALQLDQQK